MNGRQSYHRPLGLNRRIRTQAGTDLQQVVWHSSGSWNPRRLRNCLQLSSLDICVGWNLIRQLLCPNLRNRRNHFPVLTLRTGISREYYHKKSRINLPKFHLKIVQRIAKHNYLLEHFRNRLHCQWIRTEESGTGILERIRWKWKILKIFHSIRRSKREGLIAPNGTWQVQTFSYALCF